MDGPGQPSRVTRTKEEAKRTYNRLSGVYDLLAGSSEAPHRERGLELLDTQAGEVMLEIGYGTGHALVQLARGVGPRGKVYGIDLSEKMWEVARQRVAQAGLANRVILEVGDAAQLPFSRGFFHGAFASFTLELFDTPEIPQVLNECRRVLRSGGRLGVVSLWKPVRENLATRLYEWAHRRWPKYVDCRPIPLRQDLESAGYEVREFEVHSMWGLPVAAALGQVTRSM